MNIDELSKKIQSLTISKKDSWTNSRGKNQNANIEATGPAVFGSYNIYEHLQDKEEFKPTTSQQAIPRNKMPTSSKSNEKMKRSFINEMDLVHDQLSKVHERLAGLERYEHSATLNPGKVVIAKNPARQIT